MVPGIEFSDYSWISVGLAIAANILIGFAWYSPILPTGRIWLREMHLPADYNPPPKKLMVSMSLMVVGTFLLMFVLQHVFLATRDAFLLDGARLTGGLTLEDGLMGGFAVWLGFFLPQGFTSVGFENKSWTLFGVNQAYNLLTLLIAGAIFSYFL